MCKAYSVQVLMQMVIHMETCTITLITLHLPSFLFSDTIDNNKHVFKFAAPNTLSKLDYFHGFLTYGESVELLADQPIGTYVPQCLFQCLFQCLPCVSLCLSVSL
jgi:hypothetical protein